MDRLLNAFNTLYNYSFGTLWWCRERLLRERFINWASPSKTHPTLSVRKTPLPSRYEAIPMLVGSSSQCGPLPVNGVSGDDRTTYFGSIIEPGEVYMNEFMEVDADLESLTYTSSDWTLYPNWSKKSVDQEEYARLEAFYNKIKVKMMGSGKG